MGSTSTMPEDLSVHVETAQIDGYPEPLLRISFTMNGQDWGITRSPAEVWKMHIELYLEHFALASKTLPDVHWFRALVKNRKAITPEDCEEFRKYFLGLMREEKLRNSDSFCEFSEISKSSFPTSGTPKPLLEGYAMKRRGGRRFMLRGCSLAVGGIKSFFRSKFSKRWFILRADFLAYTKDRGAEHVLDVILFDHELVVELVSPSEGSAGTMTPSFLKSQSVRDSKYLKIQNGYRKVILKFDSGRRAAEWMQAIKQAHSGSEWHRHHRFDSFAPPRPLGTSGCQALVDGEAFFSSLVEVLKSAKKEIYITGWWLVGSLPLTRPGTGDTVLDILRDRAANDVKIYVVLYKELSVALALDSIKTKKTLEALHPTNVKVILHPRQFGTRAVLAWSHHQKLVVVDNEIGFLGGLDLCLGRYDTGAHRLVDFENIFPGQDYCNPCLRDAVDMSKPLVDLMDRQCEPRLPWHDVHCRVEGLVVTDLVRHFVQLWNHVKTDKHANVEVLQTKNHESGLKSKLKKLFTKRHSEEEVAVMDSSRHHAHHYRHEHHENYHGHGELHLASTSMIGRSLSLAFTDGTVMVPPEMDAEEELVESSTAKLVFDGLLGPLASSIRSTGNLGRIQLLRSGTWWSLGLPTDTSIYNAYLEFIREARNFIYIENQFFITTCVEDNEDGINNLIGKAIAERVWDSYSTGGNLKVYIVLPVMPAFENAQLMQPNGFVTRITLQHQFNAFMRGRGSILGFLESACGDRAKAEEIFSSHFVVCGLRQVDVWPDGTVRSEQLYVHSKAMIVDDHVAIIGSANINDRSMVGDRDSEVAICIEDPDFAAELRKQLWHEHFGITVHHPSLTIASDSPDVRTELIAALADPTSADCFNIWVKAANDNGEVYRDVFGVVPCDRVKTRKQFDIRMEVNANRKVTLHDADATARIRTLKGRIVAFQHKFLELEDRLQDPMPASASLCPREIFS